MAQILDTVSLTVSCSHCGGDHLSVDDPFCGESAARCADCGTHLGSWAEVKEQARAAMFDAMRDDFAGLALAKLRPHPVASAQAA